MAETVVESQVVVAPQTQEPAPSARSRARAVEPGQGIQLTEKAAEKIKEILRKENYPESMYLYVGVKGGGCSGLSPVLDLRDEAHAAVGETDEIFDSQGITVVSDYRSFFVGSMNGTLIDYQEGLMGAGFTVNNPNAKHTCGCGSSYSV